MKIGVLQARMSSSRLPGKVLEPVVGSPMISRIIDRIGRARSLDALVLVTSTDPSDDALAEVAAAEKIEVRRGPLDDVLARFEMVREEFDPTVMVRLTGDNALTDPDVIDQVVSIHVAGGYDYTSNTIVRTFPHGLDVECVAPGAFVRMQQYELSASEREHVTMGLYSRPEHFRIGSVTQEPNLSHLRWTVDYPEDLSFVREVYSALFATNPTFGMSDVLELLGRKPGINRTTADLG